MKHVPIAWLRRFQIALLLVDCVVIAVYLYAVFSGSTSPGPKTDSHPEGAASTVRPVFATGVTGLVAGIAGFHALYVAGVVWWADKYRPLLVHVIGVLTSGTMLVLIANADSPTHLFNHVLLMIFVLFATMAGTFAAGTVFIMALLVLIYTTISGTHPTDSSGHAIEMIMVNLSGIGALAGWFIFNKRYVQKADPKALESLTKLVDRERTTVGLILESITDGVMIIDTKGVVQALNSSCAKLLGWAKEEAQNLQYDLLLTPAAEKSSEAEPLTIAKTFETGQPQQQVSLFKTRDNRQVYIDITASPIIQGDDDKDDKSKKVVGIIAVLRDVDKQKREEQQRSEFISTASHEMRTPVAAIEGYLALALNNRVSTIDEKARAYIEKAHSSTQHLGKLFQDLLTSAKAEDGRLVSHPQVIEMGQYLEQIVETLRFTAEKKGLLMDFTIGSDDRGNTMNGKVIKPLYYVSADQDRLREVITNLFDNAVKYTETGKISVGLTGNNDVVQIFIKDTGPGIPKEDIPHLFQKFYRVDNSATRTIGGTGLGLFICRKIIELYKGRIWVESELGKGSTFYINIPRLAAQKADELLKAEAVRNAGASPLDKA